MGDWGGGGGAGRSVPYQVTFYEDLQFLSEPRKLVRTLKSTGTQTRALSSRDVCSKWRKPNESRPGPAPLSSPRCCFCSAQSLDDTQQVFQQHLTCATLGAPGSPSYPTRHTGRRSPRPRAQTHPREATGSKSAHRLVLITDTSPASSRRLEHLTGPGLRSCLPIPNSKPLLNAETSGKLINLSLCFGSVLCECVR